MTVFPRTLLLCSFSQGAANGITIGNLFASWPRDRIAVAEFSDDIEAIYVPFISKYYILGDSEAQYVWPFRHLRKLPPSRVYEQDHAPPPRRSTTSRQVTTGSFTARALKSTQIAYLNKTGLSLVSKTFRVSPPFDAWIRAFAPDIIYASVGDICKMDFVIRLKERYGVPLATHVFDDFVASKHQYTLFPAYWRQRLDISFRRFIDHTDVPLAISERMSREYVRRYGKPFHTFHNPIDPAIWLSPRPKPPAAHASPFKFVYAGKVNKDTAVPLTRFIDTMDALCARGYAVALNIYSPYPRSEIQRVLGARGETHYRGRVDYAELPGVLRRADGLLLPLDNSAATRRYIRLSMLTKATEYMASGTPIFALAPRDIAVTDYLAAHDAACIVDDPSRLEDTIVAFIDDLAMRRRIAANALQRVETHHLAADVREALRGLLARHAGAARGEDGKAV